MRAGANSRRRCVAGRKPDAESAGQPIPLTIATPLSQAIAEAIPFDQTGA